MRGGVSTEKWTREQFNFLRSQLEIGNSVDDCKLLFKKKFPSFDMRSFKKILTAVQSDLVPVHNLKGIPEPPVTLSDLAKKIWLDLWASIAEQKTIVSIDHYLLAAYCREMGMYYQMCEDIDMLGPTFLAGGKNVENEETGEIKNIGGYPQQRPEVGIKNNALNAALKIEKAMGINLRSRIDLDLTKKEEQKQSKLMQILNG